jgi:hypothetical protein
VVPILSTALVVVLNVALYWLAFRVLTPKEIATRDLLPGAVLGGVAWTALQALGTWLVARQLRHTSELYGTFGVVLGLLFFLYFASQIVVYAAEVNVVRARGLAPRIVDLVFESLERARDDGVTVLLIEQFVERALGFADPAVVLRHGLVGWQGRAADAGDELLAEYLGGETASTL